MQIEGGCYCGDVRYSANGEPMLKAQCHCRECQYISGGSANMLMIMPAESGFSYSSGEPKQFTRTDVDNPVTREFCGKCGTHLLTKSPALPGAAIIKVGTLDDPKLYGQPQMAMYCCDKQDFHSIPEGLPTFERLPG